MTERHSLIRAERRAGGDGRATIVADRSDLTLAEAQEQMQLDFRRPEVSWSAIVRSRDGMVVAMLPEPPKLDVGTLTPSSAKVDDGPVTYQHPDDARAEAERRLGGTAKAGPPRDDQVLANQQVTQGFIGVMQHVLQFTPPGRNQALALTHIEDAKMRAVAAIFTDGTDAR